MSIDRTTLNKLAKLSQLEFDDNAAEAITGKLSGIVDFISQLSEVNTDGVQCMTSTVADASTPERADVVKDENNRENLLKVSPAKEMGFIVVPRVIE